MNKGRIDQSRSQVRSGVFTETHVLGGEAEVHEHEGDVGHKLVGREEEHVEVPGVEHVAVQLRDAVPQLHLRLCIRRQPVLLQCLRSVRARMPRSGELTGILPFKNLALQSHKDRCKVAAMSCS